MTKEKIAILVDSGTDVPRSIRISTPSIWRL